MLVPIVIMLSVKNKSIMLNVVILSVIMLNNVAQFIGKGVLTTKGSLVKASSV